ncbi:MAG: tetratricopeptide repeat protein [Bermanella sp.]
MHLKITFLILTLIPLLGFAATQEFIREYTYTAGEADSKLTSRQMALQEVKRELLSEIGTHIYSRINISTDSSGKSDAKQEIRALTAGFVKVEVIQEKWNGYQFSIKAKLRADPDEIVQRIKDLNKKDEKSEQLKKDLIQSNQQSNLLRIQMQELRNQLTQAKSFKQKQQVSKQYIDKSAALSAIESYNQASDYYYGRNGKYLNQEKAFPLYLKAANQNHVMSQYSLGLMYQKGNGVSKNLQQAFYWFEQSAKQGYVWSQNILGGLYKDGEGTSKNLEKAVYWLAKAAEQDHTWSQYNLAKMYKYGEGVKKDYKQAVHWYRKAAEHDNEWAQLSLANSYKSGKGVKKDLKQSLYWHQKSADQGNKYSQHALAEMYYKGQGTQSNIDKAVHFYNLSAEQGNKWSQLALGDLYSKGHGVSRSQKTVRYWYEKSASQGLAQAQKQLQILK